MDAIVSLFIRHLVPFLKGSFHAHSFHILQPLELWFVRNHISLNKSDYAISNFVIHFVSYSNIFHHDLEGIENLLDIHFTTRFIKMHYPKTIKYLFLLSVRYFTNRPLLIFMWPFTKPYYDKGIQ